MTWSVVERPTAKSLSFRKKEETETEDKRKIASTGETGGRTSGRLLILSTEYNQEEEGESDKKSTQGSEEKVNCQVRENKGQTDQLEEMTTKERGHS